MEIKLKITKKHIIILLVVTLALIIIAALISNQGGGKPSEGLEYEFWSEGYNVTGIGTCTDRDIVIPEEYNGYPVVGIAYKAFYRCETIDSVYIPDTVTEIERNAFSGCINLKTVRLSKNLEYIRRQAFMECIKLEKISIPDKCVYIEENAFAYCYNLKRIDIPNSIKTFGMYIFHKNEKMEIYYSGTTSQWSDIKKYTDGYEYVYDELAVKVHCSDGMVIYYITV